MSYQRNPKVKESGIETGIPQTGTCPHNCADCFFQSGRSYLEPLEDNLPNMPCVPLMQHRILRVNDGNDSSHQMEEVLKKTKPYKQKFFNTASPKNLAEFPGPVVLTVNPGKKTDKSAYLLEEPPQNIMYVRFRTNMWNLDLAREVIDHYTNLEVPVVLTFMAYFSESVPEEHKDKYTERKRTTNVYYAITTDAWRETMKEWEENLYVSSCGKVEGERGSTKCRFCGVCLREYFATMERLDPWGS